MPTVQTTHLKLPLEQRIGNLTDLLERNAKNIETCAEGLTFNTSEAASNTNSNESLLRSLVTVEESASELAKIIREEGGFRFAAEGTKLAKRLDEISKYADDVRSDFSRSISDPFNLDTTYLSTMGRHLNTLAEETNRMCHSVNRVEHPPTVSHNIQMLIVNSYTSLRNMFKNPARAAVEPIEIQFSYNHSSLSPSSRQTNSYVFDPHAPFDYALLTYDQSKGMNIFTNQLGVLNGLKMMGDYVPPDQTRGIVEHTFEYAVISANLNTKNITECTIYGSSGIARYKIDSDGSIKFSKLNASHRVEDAKKAGFEIG